MREPATPQPQALPHTLTLTLTHTTPPLHPPCPPHPPQVFDVRMTPRMLASVPFAAGPSVLRFHPCLPSTLLLASAGGAFTLADAQGMGGRRVWLGLGCGGWRLGLGWAGGWGNSRPGSRAAVLASQRTLHTLAPCLCRRRRAVPG